MIVLQHIFEVELPFFPKIQSSYFGRIALFLLTVVVFSQSIEIKIKNQNENYENEIEMFSSFQLIHNFISKSI